MTGVVPAHDGPATVTLGPTSAPEHARRWTVERPLALPLEFSQNSRFLTFPDAGRAAVVDVATGAVRYSIPTGLVEISALAVDNTGETALVFGWEADPRYIIQKNFVVRSFPTTGHSTFTPIYLRTDSIPHIRDLAIDTKARIVAYGGGTARHRLGQGGGLHNGTTLAVIRQDGMTDWTMTPSDSGVAVTTASPAEIRRWVISREPAAAAAATLVIEADFGPQRVVLSGQGERLAFEGMRTETNEPFLAAIDLASGQRIFERNWPVAIEGIQLGPGGKYLAVWSKDHSLHLLSGNSGDILWSAPNADGKATSRLVAFSSDGRYLAWGQAGAGLFVRDLGTSRSGLCRLRRLVSRRLPFRRGGAQPGYSVAYLRVPRSASHLNPAAAGRPKYCRRSRPLGNRGSELLLRSIPRVNV